MTRYSGLIPLSPNEEIRLQQQSRQEQRKKHLLEVRQREKANASLIRKNYQQKKKTLHDKSINEAQQEFFTNKERELTHIQTEMRASLLNIGAAHLGAEELDDEQYRQVKMKYPFPILLSNAPALSNGKGSIHASLITLWLRDVRQFLVLSSGRRCAAPEMTGRHHLHIVQYG